MTQFKKVVGVVLLALVLVMSLTVNVFAAKITIDGGASGSEYAAYKIFDVLDGGNGNVSYIINDVYANILKKVTGKETSVDIVEYIGELDSDGIRAFADDVYSEIKKAYIYPDYVTHTGAFANVEQGYYLIIETALGNDADTFSLVMLDTAGLTDIKVNTKEDLPTISKQVEEINDSVGGSSWGHKADYDIGDSIKVVITGTVSAKYADYESYYYNVVDTMDKGLTYNDDAKVYVKNGNKEVEATSQFAINVTESGFTVTANLKELSNVTIDGDSEILVKYSVTLNKDAVSGEAGNLDKVYLEYENNPYVGCDDNPETFDKPEISGVTPEDVNAIFTFNAVVDKVDIYGYPLEGAGFTIYKWSSDKSDWVKVSDEITNATTFEFKGIDIGKYKLVESTVPQGYNKTDDIEFEIVAEYDLAKSPARLTDILVKNASGEIISEGKQAIFSVDFDNGNVNTEVINSKGSEFPRTGGIGTTIFYVIGGVLVLVAVVLLVAKKRMSND